MSQDRKLDPAATAVIPPRGPYRPSQAPAVGPHTPTPGGGRAALAVDPSQMMTAYSPPAEELMQLARGDRIPESEAVVSSQHPANRAYAALPADAPEWMRAARVMADSLEECLARGRIDQLEQAAIERAWYAWTLGGATPRQVLRVAHLVRRAYEALGRSSRSHQEDTLRSCAEVLHGNLPVSVRDSVPFERVLWIVRQLREEPDPWTAVVEGTAEVLGWKDYARVHAAYVICEVIKQS